MKKKNIFLSGLLAVSVLALTACGSGAKDEKASASKDDVKKIIVGTGTQFPNICFLDDDGKLTGYDVELVKELDKKLENYEFEFKTMEFSNLLMSLETNKIDLIAHQMEVNDEREEKFLFNKEPYNTFPLKVTVNENNEDIKSIDDLKGKTITASPTSNAAVFIEKYNKEHNLGAKIVYSQSTTDTIAQLKTGRTDAIINTPFAAKIYNDSSDAQQKVVGDALLSSKVYFLLSKDGQELSDDIDEALKELKEEGVVSKLSEKWLGADYSVDF